VQNQVRVVAVHDTAGNISMLIVSPADAALVYPRLEPGEYTHEVEVPEVALDMDDEQLHSRLDEVRENFRIDVQAEVADIRRAPLVRKSGTQEDY
jgi:hypothetical protein